MGRVRQNDKHARRGNGFDLAGFTQGFYYSRAVCDLAWDWDGFLVWRDR